MSSPTVMHAGAAAARSAAQSILAESRFRSPTVPHPLRSLLRTIGDAVSAPINAVEKAVSALGRGVPGGSGVVWLILAVLLALTGGVLARRAAGRALAGRMAADRGRTREATESAAALERTADAAERRGDLAEAVRLRFRAGLLRLGERGVILAPGLTPSSEVARALHSPDFELLARRFDEIAYGGAPAGAADVQEARRRWPVVVRGEDSR